MAYTSQASKDAYSCGPSLGEQARAFRLWTTPCSDDQGRSVPYTQGGEPLSMQAREFWPTPNVPNGGRKPADTTLAELVENHGMTASGKRQVGLENVARLWPTPRREDGESAGNHPNAEDSLTGATRLWVTPASRDWKGQTSEHRNGPMLPDQVQLWRTPTHGKPNKGAGQPVEKRLAGGHTVDLQDHAFSFRPPTRATASDGERFSTDGPGSLLLSPEFVTWLMGLPAFWTNVYAPCNLRRSEMASWFRQQRSHLRCLRAAWGLAEAAA